jgi:hypothetical protein
VTEQIRTCLEKEKAKKKKKKKKEKEKKGSWSHRHFLQASQKKCNRAIVESRRKKTTQSGCSEKQAKRNTRTVFYNPADPITSPWAIYPKQVLPTPAVGSRPQSVIVRGREGESRWSILLSWNPLEPGS